MPARDTYKAKVYEAEDTAFEALDLDYVNGPSPHLDTAAKINTYVRRVCRRRAVTDRYKTPRAFNIVTGRGASAQISGPYATITLGRWARTEIVILHELAHVLTDLKHRRKVAAHGPEWIACYTFLLRTFVSDEAADALRRELSDRGVRL